MRKFIIVLALLTSSFFFIAATSPTNAVAASCQTRVAGPGWTSGYAVTQNIWQMGVIYARAGFYNCSGVEAVRWKYSANFTANGAGFWDNTAGAYAGPGGTDDSNTNGCCAAADYTYFNGASSICTGSVGVCDRYVIVGCWWWGASRQLRGFFTWQIKPYATHIWSSLGSTTGAYNTVTIPIQTGGGC